MPSLRIGARDRCADSHRGASRGDQRTRTAGPGRSLAPPSLAASRCTRSEYLTGSHLPHAQ
jgi:hypothetical protein